MHHKDKMTVLASLLNEGGLLAYLRCRMQAEALKGNLDYSKGKGDRTYWTFGEFMRCAIRIALMGMFTSE